jgi:hypothetical protein
MGIESVDSFSSHHCPFIYISVFAQLCVPYCMWEPTQCAIFSLLVLTLLLYQFLDGTALKLNAPTCDST